MANPFRRKSKRPINERVYGHDATIHQNESLDVEVDKDGNVVAVWFRCQPLPFRQSDATDTRADEMRRMYGDDLGDDLIAVTVRDRWASA
jgi:hypothetical protein